MTNPAQTAPPAVGLILIDSRGWILLQLRGPGGDYPDHWGTVGGQVEPGESDGEALRREVLEETGYQVGPSFSFGGETVIVLPDGRTRRATLFFADYDTAQPIHCYEGRTITFVDPATLNRLPIYPGQRELILAALDIRAQTLDGGANE